MVHLIEAFKQAIKLLVSFDREIYIVSLLSLKISTISTFFACILGISTAFLIAVNNFFGKKALIVIFNTCLALPTVLIGLLVYSIISQGGPLGGLGLLFTPAAMVIGQFILGYPIVVALGISGFEGINKKVKETAFTLGAIGFQNTVILVKEAKLAILGAVLASFGRVFSEVGVSMMLGGNIRFYTRNLTAAIALETSKGEFAFGIALGIILLTIACGVNIILQIIKSKV